MQEEITQGAVSLSVEAGKMTADLLQKALKKVLEEMQKKPSQRTLRQGKQTLHQLKQHGASLTNIEITEQNIKAFSAVAKKYDIDYALKKDPHTEPPHYTAYSYSRHSTVRYAPLPTDHRRGPLQRLTGAEAPCRGMWAASFRVPPSVVLQSLPQFVQSLCAVALDGAAGHPHKAADLAVCHSRDTVQN